MAHKLTEETNRLGEPPEVNPLMEAYNPLPPQAETPARFYWQEQWHEASSDDAAVQAAFEN